MITITLQQEEADAIERVLDLLITNEKAAMAVFINSAERRNATRVLMKPHRAKNGEAA